MDIHPFIEYILTMDKRQKFLYSLVNYNGVSPFYILDLEKFCGFNSPQKDIRKMIPYLIDMKILTRYNKDDKGHWNLKLNKKLLIKLIRSCDAFSMNGKVIEATTLISNY